MYFKQFDFVGLLNLQGTVDLIIDKAHNWYLQTAVNQGGVCAVALIVMVSILMVSCIRRKGKEFAWAALTAVAAFAVFGLINDSNVGMTPVFFIFLGAL